MKSALAVIALLLCAGGPAVAGDVVGRVRILKPLSKERVTFSPYQSRGAFVSGEPGEDSKDEDFAKLVVYLEGDGLPAGAPIEAQIVQQKRQFSPEVVIIPVGSTVNFPNLDPILHNVFSLSKIKQFDLGYYPVGKGRVVKFDKPGVAEVYCHLHREMTAAVVVAPSAFCGQVAKDGRFAFTGVPAGEYQLVLWHKTAGFFRKRISISENGPADIALALPVPDSKAGVKTP